MAERGDTAGPPAHPAAAQRGAATVEGPAQPAADLEAVSRIVTDELGSLEREISEMELLVQQARTEAERHETRRNQVSERVKALEASGRGQPTELAEGRAQLLALTRRAALMEAQLLVLEAKQKAAVRLRARLEEILPAVRDAAQREVRQQAGAGDAAVVPANVSRAVLSAQEDLRRDIARQMHDGPAQSLANIALQAEIVHRLIGRDPAVAQTEVGELIRMVRHTLEATKGFIFDVRPMVLDDLGLVPTLRRAARDRGRRAAIPIEFESVGADRRLGAELESAFFRILDDALVGFLTRLPERVAIVLDWSERELRATVRSIPRADARASLERPNDSPADPSAARDGQEESLPPALAEMMRQRDDAHEASRHAARTATTEAHALPPDTWREIRARAATLGVDVALGDDGRTLTAALRLGG